MSTSPMHTHHPADHHHHRPQRVTNSLLVALVLTLVFAVAEALAGWWSGSLALLGDAGHMVSDATSLGLAAFAAWVAKRPPSLRHSYGLGRAEVLAAVANALLMFLVVAGIVMAAIARLSTAPTPVAGGMVMAVAALGLIINLVVAWMLRHGEQTLNTRAALLHVMGDLLGSVAALVAGAVIYFTGWMPIDPILSLLICALILFSSFHLLREALHVLMEGVPVGMDMSEVGRAMAGVSGVASIHDLHIWTLSSGRIALSAHVAMRDMRHWQATLAALQALLHDRYGIEHATLQPEQMTTTYVVNLSNIRGK